MYIKQLKNYKVKASSLMESVMATAVIAICILIATLVFLNVFKTNYATNYIQARQEVQTIIKKLNQQTAIEDHTYVFSNFTIKQEVKSYEDATRLKQVDFTIITDTKTEIFSHLITHKDETQP